MCRKWTLGFFDTDYDVLWRAEYKSLSISRLTAAGYRIKITDSFLRPEGLRAQASPSVKLQAVRKEVGRQRW